MTSYRRGYYFESRVREALEGWGWVVFRSGGSRSPVDLVAMKAGEVLLVQCKAGGRMSPRERLDFGLLGFDLGVPTLLASRIKDRVHWQSVRPDGSLLEGNPHLPLEKKEES